VVDGAGDAELGDIGVVVTADVLDDVLVPSPPPSLPHAVASGPRTSAKAAHASAGR
jgi:hypothetical protein